MRAACTRGGVRAAQGGGGGRHGAASQLQSHGGHGRPDPPRPCMEMCSHQERRCRRGGSPGRPEEGSRCAGAPGLHHRREGAVRASAQPHRSQALVQGVSLDEWMRPNRACPRRAARLPALHAGPAPPAAPGRALWKASSERTVAGLHTTAAISGNHTKVGSQDAARSSRQLVARAHLQQGERGARPTGAGVAAGGRRRARLLSAALPHPQIAAACHPGPN